jgi:hypothetical protein
MDHQTLVYIGWGSLLSTAVVVAVIFVGYVFIWMFLLDGLEIESRHPTVKKISGIISKVSTFYMIGAFIFGAIVLGVYLLVR